jgi:hypothetical protein
LRALDPYANVAIGKIAGRELRTDNYLIAIHDSGKQRFTSSQLPEARPPFLVIFGYHVLAPILPEILFARLTPCRDRYL